MWSVKVILENRLFLSDIYLLIHSTKQKVCLKSCYVLGTTEDMDIQKKSCLGAVTSVFYRNDAYTPKNKMRQNMCVPLYLPQLWSMS